MVMNKSLKKEGQEGWTHRTWEKPKVRHLPISEWNVVHRQQVYLFASRTFWAISIPLGAIVLVYNFVPMSDYSRNRYIGAFPKKQDNVLGQLQKKYNVVESSGLDPKKEVVKFERKYFPFRDAIDNYIRKFGVYMFGTEKVIDHENSLVSKLKESNSNTSSN